MMRTFGIVLLSLVLTGNVAHAQLWFTKSGKLKKQQEHITSLDAQLNGSRWTNENEEVQPGNQTIKTNEECNTYSLLEFPDGSLDEILITDTEVCEREYRSRPTFSFVEYSREPDSVTKKTTITTKKIDLNGLDRYSFELAGAGRMYINCVNDRPCITIGRENGRSNSVSSTTYIGYPKSTTSWPEIRDALAAYIDLLE